MIALSLALKTQIRKFLRTLKGPKARWPALNAGWKGLQRLWRGKDSKNVEKTTGKEEWQANGTNDSRVTENAAGQQNGTNDAMAYFHAFGPRRSSRWSQLTKRSSQSPNDVENTISGQTFVSKTTTYG